MKYYALRNDELGYITQCPLFKSKEEAEYEAMGKCRAHSVVEVSELKPCKPVAPCKRCLQCPRFIAEKKK